MSMERVFNFGAGPAVLPEIVLEEIRHDLIALPEVGMSILEVSHRSKVFDEIIETAVRNIRTLAGISNDYHILFLSGGATQQFAMVPLNLLSKDYSADYILTGAWSKKAVQEAKRIGAVHIAGSTESDKFSRIPHLEELTLKSDAAYVHMTSNNTIYGTQWTDIPEVGKTPLVVDASSDIFSRPVDISRHSLIYAGAQKNLGPAGVTLVIIRDDLINCAPASSSALPTMFRYKTHIENGSLYNTPPVFSIYVMGLVMKWLLKQGGLDAMNQFNVQKSKQLYAAIDCTDFYQGTADVHSRSLMNVTFRLPTEELEVRFIKEAEASGLVGLKGHRSVGGLRASIYNAFPEAGVEALVQFMAEFERIHG